MLNYTQTFSEGHYQIYLRVQSSAAQQVSLGKVSNADSAAQVAVAIGLFEVPATGGTYSFVPLTDTEERPLAIRLSGVEILRLTALSASNTMQWNQGAATAALPQFPCEFLVTQAGVYAFRLVWVEYVGSSSVELHVKDAEGISYLLNDEPAPLKASLARTAEPSPSEGARLVIERSGSGEVTLRWNSPGKLQSAGSLPGPWSDVEPGPNPYTVTPGATRFYRVED